MNAPLVPRLIAGLTLIAVTALRADTSAWIAPGPVSLPVSWYDTSHWDNGIVPNATDAVAVFSTYTTGQSQQNNRPGTAPARIGSGDVALAELRWQLAGGGSTQYGPDIHIGGDFSGPNYLAATLRLYGAGLTTVSPAPAGFAPPVVYIDHGILEFNQAARAGTLRITGTEAIYSAHMAVSTIVFRDQSTADRAMITAGHLLRFEDTASAGQSSILVKSAGNDGDAYLSFLDQSGAGSAQITLDSHAHVTFAGTASAQDAVFGVADAYPFTVNRDLRFLEQSTAGNATIALGDFSSVSFLDSSSAHAAKISANPSSNLQNDFTHRVEFRGNATASEATISGTVQVEFHDQASAGSAQLNPSYRGSVLFDGQSTAGQSHIVRSEGWTAFRDNATAASATIETAQITFLGHATAGTAHLSPRSDIAGATVRFGEWSSAQSAEIFLGKLGRVIFTDDADAGTAIIRMNENTAEGLVTLSGNARTNDLSIVNTGSLAAHLDISGVNRGGVEMRSISGPTKITLGANSLVFRNSDVDPAVTLAGVIGGTGGLAWNRASTLTVSNANNTFTGATTLTLGSLHLDGGRIAGLETSTGTRVTGQGKIDGNLYSRGLLSPGSSAGTITVAGDYTQTAQGSLNIEFFSPTSYDHLVVGGTANLGGVLNLYVPAGATLVGSTNFNFLTAGAINGQFDSVNSSFTPGAGLSAQLAYTATGISLAVTQKPFAGFGGDSPAATALGAHFDATLAGSTGDYRALIAGLNTLSSDAAIATALEALAPDRYATLAENSFLAAAVQQAAQDRRFAAWREEPAARGFGVFFEGGQHRAEFDAAPGLAAAESTLAGGTGGLAWTGNGFTFGAAVTQESGDADLDDLGSSADLESTAPAVFFQYTGAHFFLSAAAAFSQDDYDLRRRIVYPGNDLTATAQTSGTRNDFAVSLGRSFRSGAWRFTPQAGVLASRWQLDGFTETGAGGAALTLPDQSLRSLRTRAGVDVALQNPRFAPRLSVFWLHETEEDRSLEAAFAGGGTYVAPGRPAARDLVQASLGFDWRVGRKGAFYATLAGAWGDGASVTTDVSAGFRWQF